MDHRAWSPRASPHGPDGPDRQPSFAAARCLPSTCVGASRWRRALRARSRSPRTTSPLTWEWDGRRRLFVVTAYGKQWRISNFNYGTTNKNDIVYQHQYDIIKSLNINKINNKCRMCWGCYMSWADKQIIFNNVLYMYKTLKDIYLMFF